jgi:hypothetical protein
MRGHEHYYNWIIEWDEHKSGKWIFCISRIVIEPFNGYQTFDSHAMGLRNSIKEGITDGKDLIYKIISNQNESAKQLLEGTEM